MTNAQLGYNNLFSSWFSKSWSPFSQGWLNLEEFIMDVNVPYIFEKWAISLFWKKTCHSGYVISLGRLVGFNGISASIGYLMPEPFYTYMMWTQFGSTEREFGTLSKFKDYWSNKIQRKVAACARLTGQWNIQSLRPADHSSQPLESMSLD